jgi:hypothetical protein
VVPAVARAQVAVVDEGSFTLTVEGRRVGREDFSIRTTAGAADLAVLAAQGTIAVGDRRLLPALSATAGGVPVSYQIEERVGRDIDSRWALQLGGGRAVVRRRDKKGESSSEFLAGPTPVLTDDDVVHHLYFVFRRTHEGNVSLLIPRRNAVMPARVHTVGADTVAIAAQRLPALHLTISPVSGPEPVRDVWIDADGRLLKVSIAARGFVALREDPPHSP